MDDLNDLPQDLRRALEALDARSDEQAQRLPVGRVADRVLERLRTEPVRRPSPWRQPWVVRSLALAAGAALILAVGGVLVRDRVTGTPVAGLTLPADAVPDSLLAHVATDVAAAVDSVRTVNAVDTTSSIVSVEDLTVTELEALLSELASASEGEI